MPKPLISVIIPVYNVEKYLSKCVESLNAQTFRDFEIILIDDGSPDGCPQICDRLEAENDRIRVIHQSNKGLSGARNTGIDAAAGQFLTFVDSDDAVSPNLLERMVQTQAVSEADIVSTATATGISVSGIFTPEESIAYILKENTNLNTCAWGKLFKASLFDGIRFPEGYIFEDYATIPRLFDRAKRIAHISEVLYFYRDDNSESITHSPFSPKRMQYFTVSQWVTAFLKERYPKLVKHAKNRQTRCAVAFYKQLSKTGQRDTSVEKQLVFYTRHGIFPYLFSQYKVTSKAYGLLISICPPLGRKLFSR